MDTTLARPPIGQLLDGRYRVDSRIARGGMATVYLGTDTRLDRTVALKIAHPELAHDADFVRRFIDEARSVARLSSPNVVAVYDQGSDGDILFLAMEYVPGRTLRALLTERGRLSPRESLDLIEGVLTGLAAAHQAGIVHRDVKPENVLITASHAVKVADFGLARAAARASRTKTGMIIGTAAYLAPEQVSHGASDTRTDVYATGVMLFELLTGVQPHRGESALEVAHKHVDDAVPAPSSVAPGLPPALDALVALATSRDPELRPADASQFLQAIGEVRRGRPIAGVPAAGPAPAGMTGSPGDAGPVPPGAVLPGAVLPGAVTQPGGSSWPAPPAAPGASSWPGAPAPAGAWSGSTTPAGGPSWPAAPASPDASSWPAAPASPGASSWPDPLASPGASSWPASPAPHTASSWPGASIPAGESSWPAPPLPAGASSWPGATPADGASSWPGAPSPDGQSPWPASPAPDGASALAGPAAPPGAPSLPGGSSSPGATPLPGDSVGHGEPRHGKPGRGRAVEILPAVPAAQLADPYGGMNHTLIVSGPGLQSADEDEPISGLVHRPSGYGRREPRLQRWLFSRKFAYAALAAAVVLILGLVGWWVISGQYVAVPQVGGLAKATAATELRNLGFKVKTAHGLHDNAVTRGHVIRTDPAIGSRAHRGSVITLVPSLGPVLVQVPSVTGLKVADAEAALRRAGLTPGRVKSAASTTIPLGVVISTSPIAGLSWPQTKPVTIVESAGQPLPELVGQQESAAQQLSQQDGFQLNPEQDKNSSQPAGTITAQSPRPGTPITPGEVVTIRVSAGPQLVAIPDVQGMPAQQAIAVLQQAGFQVNVDTLSRGHRVFGYNPTGQAPKGTTITIFVGFGGF